VNETGEFSTILRLEVPSDDPGAAFLLTVVEGADRGATLLVDPSLPSRVYIGTSSSCELRLADRDVSRRHLALAVAGQKLHVADLGGANGTTANDVVLVEGFMRGGEILRLGRTAIRVERHDAVAAATTSRAERFGRIIGASPEMQRLYPLCDRLAATSVPVIIEGEIGTGKEVLAEALHEQGPRAAGPFVVFDCTAVPPSLVESELFGHDDGKGAFEKAHGGTLLIDEIGDLELPVQAKLLRVLERAEIRRVGGAKTIAVDVRVLFATRRDLDRLVEAGRFREDLVDRMSGAHIELPPLRRRSGDVRRLALHFARDIGGPAATLPADLLALWESDPWPGNVRALRDAVARWLALADLAAELASQGSVPPPPPTAPGGVQTDPFLEDVLAQRLPLVQAREKVVAELERRYAERLLAEHAGSVSRAVEVSGVARRHFQRIAGRRERSK
jgi:two-component system, NtrC family, response regulator HydG